MNCSHILKIATAQSVGGLQGYIVHMADHENLFSLPLLPKAKRSVGNKESGLEKIIALDIC